MQVQARNTYRKPQNDKIALKIQAAIFFKQNIVGGDQIVALRLELHFLARIDFLTTRCSLPSRSLIYYETTYQACETFCDNFLPDYPQLVRKMWPGSVGKSSLVNATKMIAPACRTILASGMDMFGSIYSP